MGAAEEEGEILLSDGELPQVYSEHSACLTLSSDLAAQIDNPVQESAQEHNSLAEKVKTVSTTVVDAVKDAAPKSKKALKAAAKAVMKARKRAEKQPPKKALSEVYLGVRSRGASVVTFLQLTLLRSSEPMHAIGHSFSAAQASAHSHSARHPRPGALGTWGWPQPQVGLCQGAQQPL